MTPATSSCREIARRLVEAAGDAPVSRLGGDEFAVVVDRGNASGGASSSGTRCGSRIEEPGSIRGIPVSVDASIGIALAPEDGVEVGQLVRRADVAMYAAKEARAGVVRYDIESDRNDANKLVLDDGVAHVAVERGELEVHYQPIVWRAAACSRRSRHSSAGAIRARACSCRVRSSRWPSTPVSSST